MSEWREATLGELFEVDNTKLGAHADEPTVMSLSKYDGFVRADEYFDKRIASANLDGYKVVEPGEWAFSTIHIDEGSIARNNLGHRGVISPMYTTMRFVAEDCLPEFAELLVRQSEMLAEYSRRAQGSINRRRSLTFKAFAEIRIGMPRVYEQQRIVDVMAAVDAQVESLTEEMGALDTVYRSMLRDWCERFETTRVGVVVHKAYAGATPSRARPDFYGGDIPWLKSGEVEQSRIASTAECITDAGLRGSSAKLVPVGATVLAISGQGNTKGRAGYVAAPMTTNQHVLALVPDPDKIFDRYLLHAIRTQTDALRARATGTVRPGITKAQVLEQGIPIPSAFEEQVAQAAAADSMTDQITTLEAELANLRMFRSTLLTSLLNQEIEIPESYDSLLEDNPCLTTPSRR